MDGPVPTPESAGRRRRRWFDRAALGLVLLVALVPNPLQTTAVVLWTARNVFAAAAAGVWGIFHLRALAAAQPTALRWAVWMAGLGTAALVLLLNTRLAQQQGFAASTSVLVIFAALVSLALLIPLLMGLGFLGAALVAYANRRQPVGAAAEMGVYAIWIATLVSGALLLIAITWLPAPLITAAWVLAESIPVATVALVRLAQRAGLRPQALADRLEEELERRLVWRPARRGRHRGIDLRGAALGLAAAGAVLVLDATTLLAPMRAWGLVSLIQFRNALSMELPQSARLYVAPPLAAQSRLALVELDPPDRLAAYTETSEAAIQADLVRRLAGWGASRIVLPPPLLSQEEVPDDGLFRSPTHAQPDPEADDLERSHRDLRKLEAAVRSAGNVVFAVPAGYPAQVAPDLRPEVDRLLGAALAVGSAGLAAEGAAQLPAIPAASAAARTGARVPVPVLLAALSARPPRGPVVIDFATVGPDAGFLRSASSSVRRGERLYRPPAFEAAVGDRGGWLEPARFFKGKIVILDDLVRHDRPSPLGSLPRMDALAHATATLLAGPPIRRFDPMAAAGLTLLVGILVGQSCARRNPLRASWRLGTAVFLVAAFAVGQFLGSRVWFDPVLPILAAVGAFLLATQFTFQVASAERDRNRAMLSRFLAPQVVQELLDDLNGRLDLGGRREQVCVLFVDARGFTGFSERHPPEQVVATLNDYMTDLTDVLVARSGILDKYTGDGLMAFFRVGEPPRADVENAVRAAVAMRDAAAAVSTRLRLEGREPLQLGFGLHYGDAVLGLVGSPVHLVNFTALGHPVIVAQRLQGIAAGGEVIVSEAVYHATGDSLDAEAREPVAVKGLSEPVRPYAVTGVGAPAADAAGTQLVAGPAVEGEGRAGGTITG
jgi:class 3 adenylate cyclase